MDCGRRALGSCRPDGALYGKTGAQITERLGQPHSREGERWTYRYPAICSYSREILTLAFRGGRVARVSAEKIITGDHCD